MVSSLARERRDNDGRLFITSIICNKFRTLINDHALFSTCVANFLSPCYLNLFSLFKLFAFSFLNGTLVILADGELANC